MLDLLPYLNDLTEMATASPVCPIGNSARISKFRAIAPERIAKFGLSCVEVFVKLHQSIAFEAPRVTLQRLGLQFGWSQRTGGRQNERQNQQLNG